MHPDTYKLLSEAAAVARDGLRALDMPLRVAAITNGEAMRLIEIEEKLAAHEEAEELRREGATLPDGYEPVMRRSPPADHTPQGLYGFRFAGKVAGFWLEPADAARAAWCHFRHPEEYEDRTGDL